MLSKKIISVIVFVSMIGTIWAQVEIDSNITNNTNNSDSTVTKSKTQKKMNLPFKKTWRFGGNIGFSFWNSGTDILVAPKAFYQISPQFMAGFGLTYIYSSGEYIRYYIDRPGEVFKYTSSSFGGSVLAVYRPVPYLQLSAEFEELYTNYNGGDGFATKYWNDALYLGVSFVSGSGHVAFGFQYNVLYDARTSAYASALTPIISFYF